VLLIAHSGERGETIRRVRRNECAIVEVKQRGSVIGWMSKNFLARVPPCLGRHVKSLVLAVFAVVSTHQSALGPRGGLWPVF
jgi:hypothetical protein